MVTLSWFNIANASNDEKSELYRFAQRKHKVVRDINASKSDVVCLMELRVSDLERTRKVLPEEIAIDIAAQTGSKIAFLRPQNLDELAFWRCTLYNPNKINHKGSFYKFAINPVMGSVEQKDRGVMLMFSWFEEKSSGKTFWVINSHMPIATDLKLKTVDWVNASAVKFCQQYGDYNPTIFYGGDQNTFFDLPGDGDAMMDKFDEMWYHLTKGLTSTFKSFPHDSVQTKSILDHILVNNEAKDKIALSTLKFNAIAFEDIDRANDHDLISVEIEFA
jgi:hypothetical protein